MKRVITDDPVRVGEWVCARAGGVYNPVDSYAIGLEEDGALVAGVMYNNYYPGGSVQVHIAAEPGKRWATRENMRIAFDYPFNQLQVKKIVGIVREDNLLARRIDEHLGCVLETRIKDACAGGDLLIYTMTKEQCRFLEATP
jgi:RimJ/RimL family protein N-acetyltransferase